MSSFGGELRTRSPRHATTTDVRSEPVAFHLGGADPAGAYVAADGYLPYVEGYDPRVFVVTLDVALLVPYCSSGGARALCINTAENTRARKAPSLR